MWSRPSDSAPAHVARRSAAAEFPDLAEAMLRDQDSVHADGPDGPDGPDGSDADDGAGDEAGDAAGDLRPRVSVEQAGAIIRELVKTGQDAAWRIGLWGNGC